MKVLPTALPEVLVLEPQIHADNRGHFFESWSARAFANATGRDVEFVQDNQSCSRRNVLRGIHYQVVRPQGKLARVVAGTVLDVAVDLRRSSPTFRRWVSVELSSENNRQVWIPPGFGHGYLVRSEAATFLYKTTEYWSAEHDHCVRWDDPDLGIDWRLTCDPILAAKDRDAPRLADAALFP